MDELLRVGKKAIVTIPNFGHWKVRVNLLLKGTMPITETLPHKWHNTPNLHICTIKDFYNFCDDKKINFIKSLALNQESVLNISKSNLNKRNFFSDLGIFLIKK